MFFIIEPEVAGGFGDSTVLDTDVHPPVVSNLEYRFEEWLGDELLGSFPCFIITKSAARKLNESQLSGFTLGPVYVTKSAEFGALHPHTSLPDFLRLEVKGTAGVDDLGLAADHRLVVSQACMDALRTFQLDNADIEEIENRQP